MISHKDTMALPIRQRPNIETKMLGNDRVLTLTKRNPKDNPGMIGESIFTGGNVLHAIYKEDTGLWHLKLDKGTIPIALQQHFTSFTGLMKVTKTYFDNRNVDVTEA
jgi:hypothetical protein